MQYIELYFFITIFVWVLCTQKFLIDDDGADNRVGKLRVLFSPPPKLEEVPEWRKGLLLLGIGIKKDT